MNYCHVPKLIRQRAGSFDSLLSFSFWLYQNRDCCYNDCIPEEYLQKYAFLRGDNNHWMDMMLEIHYQYELEQFEKDEADDLRKNIETFGPQMVYEFYYEQKTY